jgi:hypothetical protein
MGLPVIARTQRSTLRLASVAVLVICHSGRPKRAASSSAATTASSPGNIVVSRARRCRANARAIGGGEWPNMAPVSPRQKSMYSCPSTSTKRAPCAWSTNSGQGVDQSAIQCIGTPPTSEPTARSASASERGWVARKRARSCAISVFTADSAMPLELMVR